MQGYSDPGSLVSLLLSFASRSYVIGNVLLGEQSKIDFYMME